MLIDEIDAEVETLVHAGMSEVVGLSFEVLRRRHGNPVLSWNLSVALEGYQTAIDKYTELKIQLHRAKKRAESLWEASRTINAQVLTLSHRVDQARRWKNKIKERILELTDDDHHVIKKIQKESATSCVLTLLRPR